MWDCEQTFVLAIRCGSGVAEIRCRFRRTFQHQYGQAGTTDGTFSRCFLASRPSEKPVHYRFSAAAAPADSVSQVFPELSCGHLPAEHELAGQKYAWSSVTCHLPVPVCAEALNAAIVIS